MLNKGRHPTLPEGPATIEAFIFDFDGDLYGQRVRGSARLPAAGGALCGQGALRAQIARDGKRPRLVCRPPLTAAELGQYLTSACSFERPAKRSPRPLQHGGEALARGKPRLDEVLPVTIG